MVSLSQQLRSCRRSHLWTGSLLWKYPRDSDSSGITTGLTLVVTAPAGFPDWTAHGCPRTVPQDCWEGPPYVCSPDLAPTCSVCPGCLFPTVVLCLGRGARAGRHEAQSCVGPGCSSGVRLDRQSDSQAAVWVSALNCRELPWPGTKVDLGGDCH